MNTLLVGLAALIIGDSHMVSRDHLITTLHDDLVAQGAAVNTYGMCGAVAADWIHPATVSCGKAERHGKEGPEIDRTPNMPSYHIEALLAKHKPNLVIVEMGDTMAAYGQRDLPQAWIYQQVHALTGRIAAQNIPCVWVGPPWGTEGTSYHKTFARVKQMSEFLATVVAPCRFIDSTQYSTAGEWPTIDGQHLTAAGYKTWGVDITSSLDQMAPQLEQRP